MHVRCPRLAAPMFALVAAIGLVAGCQQSTDIPLIEFPKGAPPPPVSKADPKGPQGVNTSQGDPSKPQ